MRFVILGYGAVGQGLPPVLGRLLGIAPERITAISADVSADEQALARRQGITLHAATIRADSDLGLLSRHLNAGDALINVSVGVCSLSLIHWCQSHGVIYLDTCLEPWAGAYEAQGLTNHALRQRVLQEAGGPGHPTAAIVCGANPGLVSHFIAQGLQDWARGRGLEKGLEKRLAAPTDASPDRGEYPAGTAASSAHRAHALKVHTVQIAETDTQTLGRPLAEGEFANTWSVVGLLSEADQPCEIGLGTSDRLLQSLPPDAIAHRTDNSVTLSAPGAHVRARTWTPSAGPCEGLCITHHEVISTAHHLSLRATPDGPLLWRPSVCYAYHASPSTRESLDRRLKAGIPRWRLPSLCTRFIGSRDDEFDELGALLIADHGMHWCGSRLTVGEARACVPDNGPTVLQVNAGIAASLQWAIDHPSRGVVEPEQMDSGSILRIAMPLLGRYTSMTMPADPCLLGAAPLRRLDSVRQVALAMNDRLETLP